MTLVLTAALLLASPAPPSASASASPSASAVAVVVETTLGDITIEVDAARAPKTAANFLRYVDAGLYDGARFHRTVRAGNQPNNKVKIDVVQAGRGDHPTPPDFPPIPLERTRDTGLRHLDGAVSMARDGPDTATADIFICVGDQPELDFGGRRNPDGQGFAVFGRVIAGMEVVRRIHRAPADGQALTPGIAIRNARRSAAGR